MSVEFVDMMLLKSSLCFILTAKESAPHIKIVDVNTWSYRQKTVFTNFRLCRICMAAMPYGYMISIGSF